MDLNVIIGSQSGCDSDQVIRQKLERCHALGFHTVALAVVIDATKSIKVPLPPKVKDLTPSNLKVYTRLTVKLGETLQLYKINKSKDCQKYDLLAIEPQNPKILQYISTGNAELDILTFELTERLDMTLFKIGFKNLEQRGVCLEINYGPAQLGSSLRRTTICNGQHITERNAKNVILSSGIDDVFRLRGPKDVKSLGVLFLLPTNRCHDAVFINGQKAINLSKQRKDPASGVIELV